MIDPIHRPPTNEKEFFEVYHYWYTKLYSFIYVKTRSPEVTEDVVQQTFLKVWERRAQVNLEVRLSTQLFQIARTTLIDELRKQAQGRRYEEYSKVHLAGQYENLERRLVYKNELEYVRALLRQMPFMRQQVFHMHKFEELSYKEISAKLNISTKTVESHMALALKYIRKFFVFFLGVVLSLFV